MSALVAVRSGGSSALREASARWARELDLPLLATESVDQSRYPFVLICDERGLSLQKTGTGAPGALRVDFDRGRDAWRLQQGGGKRQLIGRALGLHKGASPSVLDATAGLGRDAFVLAGLGCVVTLLERSPVIAALLADGIRRLAVSESTSLGEVAERLHLRCVDALDYMADAAPHDVVYLDPMFPASRHSAAVKKEMQLFRELLDEPGDESELLVAALRTARYRVVVKRMKKTPQISGPAPSHQLAGKSVRFDIYALQKYY